MFLICNIGIFSLKGHRSCAMLNAEWVKKKERENAEFFFWNTAL